MLIFIAIVVVGLGMAFFSGGTAARLKRLQQADQQAQKTHPGDHS